MADIARFDADRNVLTAGGRPLVFHCHHYNLFLQRTVDEVLGPLAKSVHRQAAAESARKLLAGLFEEEKVTGFEARLARAAFVFGTLGFGQAELAGMSSHGGDVSLATSHYAIGWRSKFGAAKAPVCHFAVGFFQAAVAASGGFEPERVIADEHVCGAVVDGPCRLRVEVL